MLNRSTPTPARLRCSSGVRLTIGESEKLTGVSSALYGGTGRRATRIYNLKAAKQEPEKTRQTIHEMWRSERTYNIR